MSDDESILYVPLRSNAKALVTGAPVAALRRRLKYASVFQDQLFLESGVLRMEAGEGGSSIFAVPVTAELPLLVEGSRHDTYRPLTAHRDVVAAIGPELAAARVEPGYPPRVPHHVPMEIKREYAVVAAVR